MIQRNPPPTIFVVVAELMLTAIAATLICLGLLFLGS